MFWNQSNNHLFLVPLPRAFQHIDPEITKIPKFQNVILCFVVDIGTILAKIHSCFLIDIGRISMILEISFDDSSGLFGARLSQN